MSPLVALEKEEKPKYELDVWHTLLVQAKTLGIPADDLIEFIGTLIPKMVVCPANYKTFGGSKRDVWVLRGFYPNSPLFMKISIVDLSEGRYSIKVRPMDTKMAYNVRKKDRIASIDTLKLEQYMNKNMENHLLNAKHELPKLVEEKVMMPRCISPKGLPLFRYYKSTRKKNDVQ